MGILLNFKRSNSRRKREKIPAQSLKRYKVSLDELEIKLALELGDGDLALGIRRAIVLAAMRQPQTQHIEHIAGVSALFTSSTKIET